MIYISKDRDTHQLTQMITRMTVIVWAYYHHIDHWLYQRVHVGSTCRPTTHVNQCTDQGMPGSTVLLQVDPPISRHTASLPVTSLGTPPSNHLTKTQATDLPWPPQTWPEIQPGFYVYVPRTSTVSSSHHAHSIVYAHTQRAPPEWPPGAQMSSPIPCNPIAQRKSGLILQHNLLLLQKWVWQC